jgi:hypothetical protein
MRVINEKFINDLKNGELKELLQAVQLDNTLCLEIRDKYINIYYRGGNMLTVVQKRDKYIYEFDYNYCKHKTYSSKYESIIGQNITSSDWADRIPFIKAEMDLWFYEHPKLEREYQQVILRDNNKSSIAGDTDYFIADIEYANSEYNCRFDILGVKWLSEASVRKNETAPTLAIMELKYGDGAVSGSAGILKHFSDIKVFFASEKTKEAIYDDVENMFNQKIDLGLIKGTTKKIKLNRDIKPEFILLFANHKPVKSVLLRELQQALDGNPDIENYVDIKIAVASYLGYGLYAKKMLTVEEFIENEKL